MGKLQLCLTKMKHAYLVLERFLSRSFFMIGTKAFKYPAIFICCAVVLCIGLGIGLLNVEVETRPDIWLPQDSDVMRQFRYITANFEDMPRATMVLAVKRGNQGADVVTRPAFDDMFRVDGLLKNITTDSGYDFYDLQYDQISQPGVLYFFAYRTDDPKTNEKIMHPNDYATYLSELQSQTIKQLTLVSRFDDGMPARKDIYFGGYNYDTNTAQALLQVYILSPDKEDYAVEWEDKALEIFEDQDSYCSEIEFFYLVGHTYWSELEKAVSADIILIVIGYSLTILYVALTLGKFGSCIQSRILAGFAAVFSVIMGTVSGFGLAVYVGLSYTSMTNVLVFICVGVGVDGSFILAYNLDAALNENGNDMLSAFQKSVSLSGVSLFVSMMTIVAAFLFGTITEIPVIRAFCFYAALAVFFITVFQFIFFVPVLVFDTKRQQANRLDIFPCVKVNTDKKKSSDTPVYDGDPELNRSRIDESSSKDLIAGGVAQKESNDESAMKDKKLGFMRRILSKKLAPLLAKRRVQKVVIAFFFLYLCFSIYMCTQVELGFELEDICLDDSYYRDLRVAQEKYMRAPIPFYIWFRDMDQSNLALRKQFVSLFEEVRASKYVEPSPLQSEPMYDCWVHDMRRWARSVAIKAKYGVEIDSDDDVSQSIFYEALEDYLSDYASIFKTARFRYDIKRTNGTNGNIAISRCLLFLSYRSNTYSWVESMNDVRDIVEKNDLYDDAFAFSWAFPFWEQTAIIGEELTRNLLLAVCAIALFSMILLLHPGTAGLVVLMVCMCEVCLVGLIPLWDMKLNSMSVVCLVMSVGLAVEYAVHYAHCFMTVEGTKEERASKAFNIFGSSIFAGAVSTVLGVCPLIFARSEIYRIFFKLLFGTVMFGLSHGLILLPVLLMLFGAKCIYDERLKVAPAAVPLEIICDEGEEVLKEKDELDEEEPLNEPGENDEEEPLNDDDEKNEEEPVNESEEVKLEGDETSETEEDKEGEDKDDEGDDGEESADVTEDNEGGEEVENKSGEEDAGEENGDDSEWVESGEKEEKSE